MAVVGIYTYDIARSKVQKATRMAREEGFPLPTHGYTGRRIKNQE